MPKKGYKQTKEHRDKVAAALRGMKRSAETRARMRAAAIRRWNNPDEHIRHCARMNRPETRAKISASLIGNQRAKGMKHTAATKAVLSELWNGRKHTPKTIERMRAVQKGRTFSDASRRRMSEAQRRRFADPTNHYNWQGGKSHRPYDNRFTKGFRRRIRARQRFICADIDATCKRAGTKLHVHHIDGDKKNSTMSNCIALCASHHARAHTDPFAFDRYTAFIESLTRSD